MNATGVLVALLLLGCAGVPKKVAGPCGDAALAALVAECKARKSYECKGLSNENCPLIQECDRRIDNWERCS